MDLILSQIVYYFEYINLDRPPKPPGEHGRSKHFFAVSWKFRILFLTVLREEALFFAREELQRDVPEIVRGDGTLFCTNGTKEAVAG
jgi:hypothetical protein